MADDDRMSIDRASSDESDTPSDPIKDELESKQNKVMGFVQQAERYCQWAVKTEEALCIKIGGQHCHKIEYLSPLENNNPGRPDRLWINPTEYSLSGPPDLKRLLNKVQSQVLHRYAILITTGLPVLMRSVTQTNEQIQDWILCSLSEFRSEAKREEERVEAARAKEAARLKVPLSSIPPSKGDFMEDFIPTRLLMIGHVMHNIKSACSSYLNASKNIWDQIELETANIETKYVTICKLREYFEGVLSTDQLKQDRRKAEAALQKYHDDAMVLVIRGYRRRRQGLHVLIEQISEWEARWTYDERLEVAESPSPKTTTQSQRRSRAVPAVPNTRIKKTTRPRASKKSQTGAEHRQKLMGKLSRTGAGDDAGKHHREKLKSSAQAIGLQDRHVGLSGTISSEDTSALRPMSSPCDQDHKEPEGLMKSPKLGTPTPKSTQSGQPIRKFKSNFRSKNISAIMSSATSRRTLESTRSTGYGPKVKIEGNPGDSSGIASSPTKMVKNESGMQIGEDSEDKFVI
ncbi:hypothetical protein EAE96_008463 [Botrytis aclada]|nr:hypothetical protein EAE96_008463 [Botrytis aclada]